MDLKRNKVQAITILKLTGKITANLNKTKMMRNKMTNLSKKSQFKKIKIFHREAYNNTTTIPE